MSQARLPARIVLGVSGGIAAYKAAELVRGLRKRGSEVQVVMTRGASRFITATTLQALSGRPVRKSLWDAAAEAAMGHIELARWADAIVIAPASADTLARLAQGRADDLLTTLCLASSAPLWLAPAMNQQMWAHPATQANLTVLVQRGARVVGPASGEQACGELGPGRMSDPADIIHELLAPPIDGVLAGRRVLINAGPTLEDIDPVRFLGNRSSGRMGFAVAEAARAAGAEVHLIAGPVNLSTPSGVRRTDVRSALEMRAAVLAALDGVDVFIAAAAIADYRPAEVLGCKRKKSTEGWNLALVANPDIVAEVAAARVKPFVVGFAAETNDIESHARGKLERKQLDMIAANLVGCAGRGFESEDNALTVYWPGGNEEIALCDKRVAAARLIVLIARRLAERA
ncbi:MAG: bifunctional phosphopantothenoylcysteine decarboxylase/phosphopantothenate--cysteine ligase CoaBC [Pseudomarimonas sp.]